LAAEVERSLRAATLAAALTRVTSCRSPLPRVALIISGQWISAVRLQKSPNPQCRARRLPQTHRTITKVTFTLLSPQPSIRIVVWQFWGRAALPRRPELNRSGRFFLLDRSPRAPGRLASGIQPSADSPGDANDFPSTHAHQSPRANDQPPNWPCDFSLGTASNTSARIEAGLGQNAHGVGI
jgi:hypothetical protein